MYKKNPFIEKYDINFFIEKYIKENLSEKERNLFSNFPQLNRIIIDKFSPYTADQFNSIQSKDIDKFGKTKLIERGQRVVLKNGQSTLDTDVSLEYIPLSELKSKIDPITILKLDRIFNKMNERGVTSDLRNTLQKQAQNIFFSSMKRLDPLLTIDHERRILFKKVRKLLEEQGDTEETEVVGRKFDEIVDKKAELLKQRKKEPVIEIEEDNLDDVQKVLKDLVPLRKRLFEEFDSQFKPIKDFTEEEQYDRQETIKAISLLNRELIDLYAKELDWENKLIEKRDILDWLKTYGVVNNGYGKEVTWDFLKLPYGLPEYIKKKNKGIKAKRNRAKKKNFNSIDPKYNDIVRAIRKGKADRNKDHKFVSTTHAFKMMGGLAKWGSYGEGVTLNKLIDKKDQIERGKKLSDIQRRELDFEIAKINNYTPKRANPSENWVQGVFKEMDSKGTRGAFSKYCKATFGATTVSERKKCADKIIKDFENWKQRGERGQSPFTMKTYKRAILYRNLVNLPRENPKQLSLFQKKNPEIDEYFDAMGEYVESNLNSKEYNLYDSFISPFNEIQRRVLMFMYGLLPEEEEEEEDKRKVWIPIIEKYHKGDVEATRAIQKKGLELVPNLRLGDTIDAVSYWVEDRLDEYIEMATKENRISERKKTDREISDSMGKLIENITTQDSPNIEVLYENLKKLGDYDKLIEYLKYTDVDNLLIDHPFTGQDTTSDNLIVRFKKDYDKNIRDRAETKTKLRLDYRISLYLVPINKNGGLIEYSLIHDKENGSETITKGIVPVDEDGAKQIMNTFFSYYVPIAEKNLRLYIYPKEEEKFKIKTYTTEEIKEILNSDRKDEKGRYKRTNFMDLYVSPFRPIPSSDYGRFVKAFDVYELNDTKKRELGLDTNKFYYLADASKILMAQANNTDDYKKWKAYEVMLERSKIKNIAPNRYEFFIELPLSFIYGGEGKDKANVINKRIARIKRFADKDIERGLNELKIAINQSLSRDEFSPLQGVYFNTDTLATDLFNKLVPQEEEEIQIKDQIIESGIKFKRERINPKQLAKALFLYNHPTYFEEYKDISYEDIYKEEEKFVSKSSDNLKKMLGGYVSFIDFREIPVRYNGEKALLGMRLNAYKGTDIEKLIKYTTTTPRPKRKPAGNKIFNLSLYLKILPKSENEKAKLIPLFDKQTTFGGLFHQPSYKTEGEENNTFLYYDVLSEHYSNMVSVAFKFQKKKILEKLIDFTMDAKKYKTKNCCTFRRFQLLDGIKYEQGGAYGISQGNTFLKVYKTIENKLIGDDLSEQQIISEVKEILGYLPTSISKDFSVQYTYRNMPYTMYPFAVMLGEEVKVEIDYEEILKTLNLPDNYLYLVSK